MSDAIYPCLWFDGKAQEAAEFYLTVFKTGTITQHSPMVVNFELDGKPFMALNGGPMYTINPSISFTVACGSLAETNTVWDKLINGGKALMPIDRYDWSERYGWLQDKFGVTWQVTIGRDAGSQKITPSLLFANHQFGKAASAISMYQSIFAHSSVDMLVHYPQGSPYEGHVLYSELKLNGCDFIAMDGPGGHEFTFNEGVSFVVPCENQQEIDYYWAKLTADGGKESMCGWLKDSMGISWQIIPKALGQLLSHPEKGNRAMQALLKMKKLEIEKLQNA
jgi:predicted 3-demethylubiquinone-9 3-methyltransferase (glyoxalase superfamily)